MSIKECLRKSLRQATQKQRSLAKGMFINEEVEVELHGGRVYVRAYGQETSKLHWSDKRAKNHFVKLVRKHGLVVQSSAPSTEGDRE